MQTENLFYNALDSNVLPQPDSDVLTRRCAVREVLEKSEVVKNEEESIRNHHEEII